MAASELQSLHCCVRSNPFIQHDGAAFHYNRRSYKNIQQVNAATVVIVRDRNSEWESPTNKEVSELEYGPGIVQKLREKFNRLAQTASKNAHISHYSKEKKFPSVDDLLSDETKTMPTALINREGYLSKELSKSIGDLDQLVDENETGSEQGNESISILRAKFERNSGRGAALRRCFDGRLNIKTPEKSVEEPEFVAISRRLRHVELEMEEMMTNPPDPILRPLTFSFIHDVPQNVDQSPPPEEPTPSNLIITANDGSGIDEMRQMLDKFALYKNKKPKLEEKKPAEETFLPSPEISSISVEPKIEERNPTEITFEYVAASTTTSEPKMTEEIIVASPPVQKMSPQRKSLSAQFFESKEKRNLPEIHLGKIEVHAPIKSKNHLSDLYPPEILEIDQMASDAILGNNEQGLIAGDGNPVRHSLLSLVAEEDMALLLDAMAENFQFYFEDLETPELSPVETMSLHAIKKNLDVSFCADSPIAYTYLNENGSIEREEWTEGVCISFEEYEKLCAQERDEYANNKLELLRWQTSLESNQHEIGHPTPLNNGGLADFVPSKLSASKEEETRTNASKSSLLDCEEESDSITIRPLIEGDSFSTNCSDLLF